MMDLYRDKLIKLTDMVAKLRIFKPSIAYVMIDANEWNKFLKQLAELGVDYD